MFTGFVMESSLAQESGSYETTEVVGNCLYRMLKWTNFIKSFVVNLFPCLFFMCDFMS